MGPRSSERGISPSRTIELFKDQLAALRATSRPRCAIAMSARSTDAKRLHITVLFPISSGPRIPPAAPALESLNASRTLDSAALLPR
jgi:hypothetical protein